jgi:hypothetical protein
MLMATTAAALDCTTLCPRRTLTDITYAYEDSEKLVIRFAPGVTDIVELGTYVRWELNIHQCGDFQIKVLDTDFQMMAGASTNISIGWQDETAARGLSVCSVSLRDIRLVVVLCNACVIWKSHYVSCAAILNNCVRELTLLVHPPSPPTLRMNHALTNIHMLAHAQTDAGRELLLPLYAPLGICRRRPV